MKKLAIVLIAISGLVSGCVAYVEPHGNPGMHQGGVTATVTAYLIARTGTAMAMVLSIARIAARTTPAATDRGRA